MRLSGASNPALTALIRDLPQADPHPLSIPAGGYLHGYISALQLGGRFRLVALGRPTATATP